jgi:hypothetical protein
VSGEAHAPHRANPTPAPPAGAPPRTPDRSRPGADAARHWRQARGRRTTDVVRAFRAITLDPLRSTDTLRSAARCSTTSRAEEQQGLICITSVAKRVTLLGLMDAPSVRELSPPRDTYCPLDALLPSSEPQQLLTGGVS